MPPLAVSLWINVTRTNNDIIPTVIPSEPDWKNNPKNASIVYPPTRSQLVVQRPGSHGDMTRTGERATSNRFVFRCDVTCPNNPPPNDDTGSPPAKSTDVCVSSRLSLAFTHHQTSAGGPFHFSNESPHHPTLSRNGITTSSRAAVWTPKPRPRSFRPSPG